MPRVNLIILDQPAPEAGPGRSPYRIAFWADVPVSRQGFYANASVTSAWSGATATDITALRNGSVVEEVITFNPDTGATFTAMGATLTTMQATYQTSINAYNPWGYYGTYYVSTATPAWTTVTTA